VNTLVKPFPLQITTENRNSVIATSEKSHRKCSREKKKFNKQNRDKVLAHSKCLGKTDIKNKIQLRTRQRINKNITKINE